MSTDTITVTLEALNAVDPIDPPSDRVRIYSGEHHAWWRAGGSGYASQRDKAGIFTFKDAWARSSHCGPEKKIEYEFLPEQT